MAARWESLRTRTFELDEWQRELSAAEAHATGVPEDALRDLANDLFGGALPEGFAVHPKVAKQHDAAATAIRSGEGITWATAEALAFGSLVAEGYGLRLTGEDTGRGTFSQ